MEGLHSEPESPQKFVSCDRKSREHASPSLQVLQHSITGSDAKDVLREFNRDTLRVAVALGILLLAALLFVVLFPEREAKSDSSSAENAATLFRKTVPDRNGSSEF